MAVNHRYVLIMNSRSTREGRAAVVREDEGLLKRGHLNLDL